MLATTANQVLQGVLLGGLYAMFAMGLSLSVGVLRFVNIAHGDLIVAASFLLLTLTTQLGLPPWLAVIIVIPIAFGAGYLLQRLLFQRVLGKNVLPIILVTFGLSIIIQNGLLGAYGADTRKVSGGGFETATLPLGHGINVGVLPLVIFLSAIAMIAALDRLLYATRLGARIRAVSDDVGTADLVGLPSARIYAIAMGIVGVTIAISAGFMSIWTNFDPTSGPSRLINAFEAVVLGGLGSLWGTLAGGIVLGVAQSLGAEWDAAWQVLAGHLVFLAVFLIRPQGLFPRA
jgi:branched-chain amino acid transport system permease protein